MPAAINVMRDSMRAYAEGKVYQPPRVVLHPPQLSGYTFLKPAVVAAEEIAFGLKVITFFPDNPSKRELPAILGFIALFDAENGALIALLDGGVATEIRTGAVSGVATDALARPDAGDLALIGAGAQARAHLAAMASVRTLRRVRVWNRTESGAKSFAAWAADNGFDVEVSATVREAVRGADLVCTVTSSREPLLDGEWLTPGVHVNAVGAFEPTTRELHTNVVTSARVVVDSRESAAQAAGDLLIPVSQGALAPDVDYPEIGEILTGARAPARTGADDITVFESLGLALQDVAAAAHVVAVAREKRLGVEVPF